MADYTRMETVADLLVKGLGLGPLEERPIDAPEGARSCISGQSLSYGYHAADFATKSTSDPLTQFHGNPGGWISENEGICFRNNNPREGMPTSRQCLVFADGTYYYPLISRESAAKQARPCWSDLVREIWPARAGQTMAMLLTTDPKKRLWPMATTGPLGSRTPVYLYANGAAQTVYCDWPSLLIWLQAIEIIYEMGFTKRAISESLMSDYRIATEVGLAETRRLDDSLVSGRQLPWFDVALLIAQRKGE